MKKSIFTFTFLMLALLSFTNFSPSKIEYISDYRVTFINKYWNNLHLQVRVGNQPVPENNTQFREVILKKGESITIDYDVLCYYRRDADPDHSDGKSWTTWTSAGCFRNNPCVIDNP